MKIKHILLLFLAPFLAAILSSSLAFTPPVKETPPPFTELTVLSAPADTLSEWECLQMAIAFTESRFNPGKKGKAGDLGVYQIIPVYVRELNRLSGYEAFRHEDALDIGRSIEMFSAMQDFYNPEHDFNLAIYHHNKSSAYRITVLKNYQLILRYENMRAELKRHRK